MRPIFAEKSLVAKQKTEGGQLLSFGITAAAATTIIETIKKIKAGNKKKPIFD